MGNILFNADILAATFRIATPILLAALGGILCQRAGVFNIGLEGMMLVGSFSGIAAIQFAGGSMWAGLVGAMIAGLFISLIFAIVIINFKADHIIASIGINLLSLGLTTFLLKTLFGASGSFRPEVMNKMSVIKIPLIKDIPIIGPAIGIQHPITYFALIMVAITAIILFRTSFGLSIRSVGEMPEAARTAGIKPELVKFIVILWSGALCGLAGAHLSISIVSEFSANMVQGRGFTAFTAVIFGGAHPILTWLVTLLFGFADALGIRIELEGIGLSPSILKMYPYILAIIVLTISAAIQKKRRNGVKF
ncbi:ABC transporter permease [Bacillus sp. FJAT-50079]|uniref:ABC transporter permease n=1 Tax=Bacillus sp. FJAT-50079 TaxID=2833577 RepID=UPI001BC8D177|nr:ABC transporter permease [Bacillus sp. FJAT-50079]MBS4208212.1 ABC transporter permease [Bacillus sp. FJAT-50079]